MRNRLGLRAWEYRHVEPMVARVYPRIIPLRSLPRPVHTQPSVGDYVSSALGEGIEPGDVRRFAPGDRIKQVNWRASLRLGQLYVTQRHRERNADVVLMLDTLAEVGAPPETTLDQGVRAAASLATAYLARKDRVGLITYGGVLGWVRPGSGPVQYERLADGLLRADVVFTYVAKDLQRVPPRVLSPQALVLAITPLLDRRFAKAVLDLAARGFDVVVLLVSPVAVTRAAIAPSRADDLAGRLWDLERRADLTEPAPPRPARPRVAPVGAARGGPRGDAPTARPPRERGMTRLLAAASAGALFLLLRLTTAAPPVVAVGLVAAGLAAVAVATTWRWAATWAAVVFVIAYAAALRIERRPLDAGAALGFGLALLLLLGAVDARRPAPAARASTGASSARRSGASWRSAPGRWPRRCWPWRWRPRWRPRSPRRWPRSSRRPGRSPSCGRSRPS